MHNSESLACLVYGFLVSFALDHNFVISTAVGCVVYAVGTILKLNSLAIFVSSLSSILFCGILISFLFILNPSFTIPASSLVASWVLMFFAFDAFYRSDFKQNVQTQRDLMPTLIAVAVAPLLMMYSKFGSVEALNFIVATGEDNASWLENISRSQSGSNVAVTNMSGDGTGHLLGQVFASMKYLVYLATGHDTAFNSPRVLMLTYGFTISFSVAAILMVINRILTLRGISFTARLVMLMCQGLVTWFLLANFLSLGHLPAALASLWMGLSLLNLILCDLESNVATKRQLFSLLLILAAGLIWLPVLPPTLLVLTYVVYKVLKKKLVRFSQISPKIADIIGATVAVSLLILGFKFRFGVPSIATFSATLHFSGATSDLIGFALALAILGMLLTFLDIKTNSIANFVVVFVLAYVGYFIVIYLASLATAPFEAGYAARKLSLVTGTSLIIAGFVPATLHLVSRNNSSQTSRAVIVLTSFMILAFQVPGERSAFPFKELQSKTPWVPLGLQEIRADSERPVICINTSNDSHAASFDMYVCNRIFGAIQASDDRRLRSWASFSLQEDLSKSEELDSAYLRKLKPVVLVTDGLRNATENISQAGYLTKFPWDAAKRITITN